MKKWAGVDPATGSAMWYLNGKDGETTTNYNDPGLEYAYMGESALPKFTGGFGTHVDFKGVFLDVNFFFAGGHKVFEDWAFYTHHAGVYTHLFFNGVEELMDRWQEPGDITNVPKVLYTSSDYSSSTSSRFLFDGDYLRLKDVAIGYNLPSSIVNKIRFSGVSIFARGTNLLTWVKDKGLKYDPEVGADGFTMLTTPPVKSIVFGVNLKF
jgi:hypothetical protein